MNILATFTDWFSTTVPNLGAALLSALVIYIVVIAFTRLAGVRSFAKMSGFDFAMTIAVGSVIASTALSPATPLPVGIAVLAVLFGVQWGLAKGRVFSSAFSQAIDNEPVLVMSEGQILQDNLDRSGVTRNDLMSKLREANVLELRCVRAVIVETTGDVSVIHGDPDTPISPEVMEGVRHRDRLLDSPPTRDSEGNANA